MGSTIQQIFTPIALFFDTFGAVVVTVAGIVAIKNLILQELTEFKHKNRHANMEQLRLDLSHKMVLGIEFFLVGDIIKTVTSPSLEALGRLAALVIVRTILNFFLRKDLEKA